MKLSLLFFFFFLTGCCCTRLKPVETAASLRDGPRDPSVPSVDVASDLRVLWNREGHQLTTFLIASFAGLPLEDCYALTYYSQYPDLDMRYDAVCVGVEYFLVPWDWPWGKRIMAGLHSLHGGDADRVLDRRIHLYGLVCERLKKAGATRLQDAGLFIHAFGDSFAHTRGDFASKSEKAYGYFIGHAIELENPDEMAYPQVFPKYHAYAVALFAALNPNSTPAERRKLNDFLGELEVLSCKKGEHCGKAQINQMKEAIFRWATKEGYSAEELTKFNNKPRLSQDQIQSVIDAILHTP